MIDSSQCYRPVGGNLASTIIDGDAVLVNLATGIYYSLDDTAGAVWQMIEKGHSVGDIGERLAARYETTPAQALADVEKLMTKLLAEKLIALTGTPAPAVAEPAAERRLPYRTPELDLYTDMSDLLALDPPMPGLPEFPVVDRK
jgi:hypothetical protein